MGCSKFSKDFSDDSPARMWMGIWWEFVWNGKMMINPGKLWLTLGFRGVPWAPCQSDKAICCSKAIIYICISYICIPVASPFVPLKMQSLYFKFHERTVSDPPEKSLMAFGYLWASRKSSWGGRKLSGGFSRKRKALASMPSCKNLAESQRLFYAKPWNQWRKTSIPSGKRLHNELERSTMLWMGKSHYFDWAMFNSYFDITRG